MSAKIPTLPPNPPPRRRAPSASAARRGVFAISGLVGLLLLAGCARPVGDFGRAEINPLNDTVMPLAGDARAYLSKEPVSAFNLTDQEQEMRDRIWHYLIAPHAFDWFQANLLELQRTRILPVTDKSLLPLDRYYKWLHFQTFASSHTRFSRIGDDAKTDLELMPDAFASICAVVEVDRERGVAANGVPNLEEQMKSDAAARQAENRGQIAWFVRAVRNRYDSYNYALDHLLVETPHEDAVGVNAELNELEIYVDAAERADFCNTALGGGAPGVTAALPSRILQSDDTPPVVIKKGS